MFILNRAFIALAFPCVLLQITPLLFIIRQQAIVVILQILLDVSLPSFLLSNSASIIIVACAPNKQKKQTNKQNKQKQK